MQTKPAQMLPIFVAEGQVPRMPLINNPVESTRTHKRKAKVITPKGNTSSWVMRRWRPPIGISATSRRRWSKLCDGGNGRCRQKSPGSSRSAAVLGLRRWGQPAEGSLGGRVGSCWSDHPEQCVPTWVGMTGAVAGRVACWRSENRLGTTRPREHHGRRRADNRK